MIRAFPELVELLGRDGVKHQCDPAARAVRIATDAGTQIIRWQEDDGVLQFIQSLVDGVPAERLPALEAAAARVNHALAWPGVDVDHAHRLASFRAVLPLRPRGGVEAREIRACFSVAVRAATLLAPTFRRVVAGELAPQGAVEDIRRALSAAPLVFDID